MSLSLIATPLGNSEDITLRAINELKAAEVIIVEEFRPLTTLLKQLGIEKPQLEQLNEHSSHEDISRLAEFCANKRVALVSDCGTPGFCDPGAELVKLCRDKGITTTSLPGPSSLMLLLSMTGVRLDEFIFRGFPPAKREERETALAKIAKDPMAQIIMDTPYRMQKLLAELAQLCPDRFATIGANLTQESEQYISDRLVNLSPLLASQKAEFIMLLHRLSEN